MVSMSGLASEMDMDSPPHSPPSAMTSNVIMEEMDMEQDDDDINALPPPSRSVPSTPMMISRILSSQPLPLHSSLPRAVPTDKLPAPLKHQDVIIKSYNPKGKLIFMN